jgi:hypothetical protein
MLSPIVALAIDHVTYRIKLADVTSVHTVGRSVELSVSISVVNRMSESGPTQEHFEFLFRVPKEVGAIFLIHTTRVETKGMNLEVEFADEKSARAFETFIRENMRGSNQTMKPTITAVRFGQTSLLASFLSPQFSRCPSDGGLSYSR